MPASRSIHHPLPPPALSSAHNYATQYTLGLAVVAVGFILYYLLRRPKGDPWPMIAVVVGPYISYFITDNRAVALSLAVALTVVAVISAERNNSEKIADEKRYQDITARSDELHQELREFATRTEQTLNQLLPGGDGPYQKLLFDLTSFVQKIWTFLGEQVDIYQLSVQATRDTDGQMFRDWNSAMLTEFNQGFGAELKRILHEARALDIPTRNLDAHLSGEKTSSWVEDLAYLLNDLVPEIVSGYYQARE